MFSSNWTPPIAYRSYGPARNLKIFEELKETQLYKKLESTYECDFEIWPAKTDDDFRKYFTITAYKKTKLTSHAFVRTKGSGFERYYTGPKGHGWYRFD